MIRRPLTLRRTVPVLVPVILLVLWQFASSTLYTSALVLPPPVTVAKTLWSLATSGELWSHVSASLVRLVMGGTLGAASGILAGLAIGRSEVIAALTRPLVGFFSGLDGVVWIPIAFVWFGTGLGMTTFILWNAVFFIVLANTIQGVQQSHVIYQSAIRTMGGNRWDVIRAAVFPSALPAIFTGVRVGMGFAWRALIAAEMLGSPRGLGQMIFSAVPWQRTDVMVAGAIVIGTLGMLFDSLVLEAAERRTVVRWGMVTDPAGERGRA